MHLIPIETVNIGPRQRKKMDAAKLLELRDSILANGLFHPIVVSAAADGTYFLRLGERRLTAIKTISQDRLLFYHDATIVPEGMVPATFLHEMTDVELFEAEFAENVIREDLSWQDRTQALAELHRMRTLQNPAQTVIATAREIQALTSTPSNPKPLFTIRSDLAAANIVAPHLDDPTVAKARSLAEAEQLILKREHDHFKAQLIAKTQIKARVAGIEATLVKGDALRLMPDLDPEQFDLILSDPPYGQGAHTDAYGSRTEVKHNYDDSPENARALLKAITIEGWRLTRPKANLFLFINFKNWFWLEQLASQMGWSVWQYPIIWQKSLAEGLTPWKRHGFARTYDTIFWATKGQRGIDGPALDILTEGRVGRNEREHGAEKPIPLLERIISLATIPGERVFDPCAGSGTTLIAAKRLRRASYGIEISQEYADAANLRLHATKEGSNEAAVEHTTITGLPLPPEL
jgi:site-specific DNA-methyltransferase (adenine-specific)